MHVPLGKDFKMSGKPFRLNFLKDPGGRPREISELDALCPVFPAGHPNQRDMEVFLQTYHIPHEWPHVIIPHGHYSFRQRSRKNEPMNMYWRRSGDVWNMHTARDENPVLLPEVLVLVLRTRAIKPQTPLREQIIRPALDF